jgi:hypothetical protein
MRWWIEIIDIVGDERFLADLLTGLNITLDMQENRTYLTSDQFNLLSTNTEVWEEAKRIRDIVSEVSNWFPNVSISFQLDSLYEQKENGSRSRHVFLSATSIGSSSTIGVLTVTSTSEISEEERARLEAEQLEREYQEKLALVSSRLVSAFRDERALKVYRFLQKDLTPARMYHIYELIRDDFGANLNSLASKKDWERFTRSVNHQ